MQMLLLAVVVYDLPTGTVSLCLAVDSARTAFHYAGPTVWKSLPDELRNADSFDSFKRFLRQSSLAATSVRSALDVFNEMHYINLWFTCLVTVLYIPICNVNLHAQIDRFRLAASAILKSNMADSRSNFR